LFSSEYANAGQLWKFTRGFSLANMQNIDTLSTLDKNFPGTETNFESRVEYFLGWVKVVKETTSKLGVSIPVLMGYKCTAPQMIRDCK